MNVTCRLMILLVCLAAGCVPAVPAPIRARPIVLPGPGPAAPPGRQPIIPYGRRGPNGEYIVDQPGTGPALFACTISAAPTCVLGEGPVINVALTNLTDQDFYLIRYLGLSGERGRYPFVYFEVTRPDDEPIRGEAMCPLVGGLYDEAFVLVPGGTSFNPFDFQWPGRAPTPPDPTVNVLHIHRRLVQTPGVYRFRLVYSTASANIADYAGWSGGRPVVNTPLTLELFEQVPKLVVKSNEIQVTILPPGSPPATQ